MSRDRARQLRLGATDAERLLWRDLREFKRHGLHFRRQAPIGPYVADFACHSVKLIIELDGGQHNDPANREHDGKRTAFVEARGYRVVRIWNVELFADPGLVVEYILDGKGAMSAVKSLRPEVGARFPPARSRRKGRQIF